MRRLEQITRHFERTIRHSELRSELLNTAVELADGCGRNDKMQVCLRGLLITQARGSVTTAVVPLPSVLVRVSSPPIARTSPRLILNPSPL